LVKLFIPLRCSHFDFNSWSYDRAKICFMCSQGIKEKQNVWTWSCFNWSFTHFLKGMVLKLLINIFLGHLDYNWSTYSSTRNKIQTSVATINTNL
jgi:hypothetical protein